MAKSRTLIHKLHESEYAKHDAANKEALAQKLLSEVEQSGADEAGRYALLHEALEQATRFQTALSATDAIDERYDMPSSFKGDVLASWAPRISNTSDADDLANAARSAAKRLSADAKYVEAAKLGTMTLAAAGRVHLVDLPAIRAWATELDSVAAQWQACDAARKKLQSEPDEPAANEVIGRFYCLARGDWKTGLVPLSKAADRRLADLAKADLTGSAPSATKDQRLAAANGWWDAASSQPPGAASQMKARACDHYRGLLPTLDGLTKLLAERRLAMGTAVASDKKSGNGTATVNLLEVLAQDPPTNEWKLKNGVLVSPPEGAARFTFPYQPPEEYDYTVEFVRSAGEREIVLGLSKNEKFFLFDIGIDDKAGWLGPIGGHWDYSLPTKFDVKIKNGRKYRISVQVRNTGVRCYLDGKIVVDRKTDFHDFELRGGFASDDLHSLTLGSLASTIEYRVVTVTEVTGHGEITRKKP